MLVELFPEWSLDKIASKIGVTQRHIAAEGETAGDMAAKAAEILFHDAAVEKSTVDFILFCTQSPDYFLPTTACLIQDKLGLRTGSGALDFNLGCSGYVYGLALAKGLVCSGIAKNVLLLTADTYSKYIHPSDKSNRAIFGDAATATLISKEGFGEIGGFVFGTDGAGAENLIVRSGASRNPSMNSEVLESLDPGGIQSTYLFMNGSAIFNFTLDSVPKLVAQVLAKNVLTHDEISLFLFHQANSFMLTTLRKVCKITEERFYIDMNDVGNTVSSTIPVALSRLKDQNRLPQGNVLLSGFGVGYSWGGCILTCR